MIQPVVKVEDAGGNPITTATNPVALTIASQPGSGANVSCNLNPVVANSGVASFAGCQIVGTAGSSYTLLASSSGLAPGTSLPFSITVGTATQLAFTTQPGGGANTAVWAVQPVVSVEDSGGNVVSTGAASVQLALAAESRWDVGLHRQPEGNNQRGRYFAGCKVTGLVGSYSLMASATGLSNATSNTFKITFGTATQLVFTALPGGGNDGVAWTNQPSVSVEDASGNLVTSNTANITLGIQSQPGSGATLTCSSNTVAATGGVASFTGCQITGKAGNYTISASATGLTPATSAQFNIAVGNASQLVFANPQTFGGPNGAAWGTQPVVNVEDVGGNLVASATNSVNLAIASQPGSGATLGCTTNPRNAVNGVDNFAGCQITGKAGNYTISASATGLTPATSLPFAITFGNASQLVFSAQPGGGADGVVWTNQPSVSVEDSGGNLVTSATNSILLAVGTNPGGTLACTTNPLAASGGTASFAGCKITGTLGSYNLTATAAGLTPATSSNFNITFGTASQLVFTAPPGGGNDGVAWTNQPSVSVEDALGNVVTNSNASINLAIASQPGSGATLGCTTNPRNAVNGVDNFAGCQITGKAGNYTISASATGLTPATSAQFNIAVGNASQLVFANPQTFGGPNGAAWGTQPVVNVEDVGGNLVASATNSVNLAIASQPGSGATLGCTTNPRNAVNGVDNFAGCQITGKAGNYTISASATGLTPATSLPFAITFGNASQLVFSAQPGGGADGVVWTNQPSVSVEDSGGNLVTSATNSILLAIGTNPGGTLACTTNPLAASGGTASFAGCKITGTLGSYNLTATAAGLTPATSSNFNITFGTATQLVFTAPPGGGNDGVAWTNQPSVSVEDALGNVVTNSNASITLAIASQPGSGATLGCTTNPRNAVNGVDNFAGCQITGKAGNYTISASATGLTPATSAQFNIAVGNASQLVFANPQTFGGPNGAAWGTQPVVNVEDVGGNLVASATNSVNLAIASQPGSGATLGCTTNPRNAVNGVDNFAGCQITGKAGNYTISASATGLTPATSLAFAITFGNASQLVFSAQPGGGADGVVWTNQPSVSVEDSGGNLVTSATNSILLAIGTNPGGTLACTTNPLAASGGTASFAGCKITGTLGSYNLTATAAGLTPATSSNFNITFGTATQLVFTAPPGGGNDGVAWTNQPSVSVEDALGNVVTNSNASITLAIASQPGSGATLGCTTNPRNAVNGVDNFAGCQIVGQTGNYTISASATGLTPATSAQFNIAVGNASQLVFANPQTFGGPNGAAWGTQPVVNVEDVGGNLVASATNSVNLAIASQPGSGATLGCTTNPRNAVNGVDNFAGCQITGKAGNYTISASATGLTPATSLPFAITFGNASQLVFSAQPGGGSNGQVWAQQPSVSVEDSGGNLVTSATNSILLAIGTNPGGTLACTTNPLAASAGTASFAGCKITGTLGSYNLTATAAGLTPATSSNFNVASVMHISALSGSGTGLSGGGGGHWNGTVTVTVKDGSGNPVSGVTVTGAWNPTAATANGCTTVANGTCSITTTTNFPNTQFNETWTVSNLVLSGYTYNAAANVESSFTVSQACSGMCQNLLQSTYDTTGATTSESLTLNGANGTAPNNSSVLVLVFRHSAGGDTSVLPSGSAISNATLLTSDTSMGGTGYYMWAYEATGTGVANGVVNLSFGQGNTRTFVEVIVLSGNNNSIPVALTGTNNGTSNSAAATLTSATSGDAEIDMVFVEATSVTPVTPTGFNTVAAHSSPADNFSTDTFFGATAATSVTSSIGSSNIWGTIALEIAHP